MKTINCNTLKAALKYLAWALILGLLLPGAASALDPVNTVTQYTHDSWTSEDGLPQNSVYAIVQTGDGYLWLGTYEGLARFDGVGFTIFDKDNTEEITDNQVTALAAAKDGNLWIGIRGGGLLRLKDGKFKAYTTQEGLSSNDVNSIYEDRDANLWIGTAGGLNKYRDGKFTAYTTNDGLSSSIVSSIHQGRDGSLWAGTVGGGLNRFNDGTFCAYTTKDGLADDSVSSIYEDKEGSLWIGTSSGLNRYKDGIFTVYTTQDGLTHSSVGSVHEDNEGNLWIGTSGGGLDRFKDGKFAAYTTKDGLSNDTITAIYEDNEGSLWVGTNGGGLNRFKDSKFTVFNTKQGLSHDFVWSVYEDKKGRMWFGTNGGLSRLENGKFTLFTTKDGVANNSVSAIYEDREANLWIGAHSGLSRFKDGTFNRFTTKDGLSSNSVFAIYEDRKGSLWIGTQAGLNRFKDGKFTHDTTDSVLSRDIVRSIYEDSEGSLWLGTYGNGLKRLKDGTVTVYTTNEGLAHNDVGPIYEDGEGSLWIGTYGGGLNRLKDGKFTTLTTKQGLFNDVVYQILEDDNANLWMSCNKGIFRVSKQQLNDFADGKISAITSVPYSTSDGLLSSECNGGSPAGWKSRDGRLWFPTVKGVAVINPAYIKLNTILPPVAIEKVVINGHSVNLTQAIRAAPGKGELEFEFTALSFLVPEKVRFKYQLEGFDGDWVDAGTTRKAHYTNIPPGQYKFRVIACNNDGLWNETGTVLEFYLTPHFYQTRAFYGSVVVALVLLVFGAYRLRVKQLYRRTQQLEQTVNDRTLELQVSQKRVLKLEKQATEQQMAGGFAHEMRNALAGSKLILDQALALDSPAPQVSLNLANCRNLKEIYLGLKGKLPEDETKVVLGKMQEIFANEERITEVMQLVRKATSRGLKITQQIMDYSKIGLQEPGQNNVDINKLIRSIVDESQEQFSSQGIVVNYKGAVQPLPIIGDETHFHSIFKNVILNARDAVIDPSIVRETDRHIEITAEQRGETCSVEITDNGIGIAEEHLQKIFEPFFSTKPASGTGLGLGMVKKMVALYNGRIDFTSEVGKRTSVRISLPVSHQRARL